MPLFNDQSPLELWQSVVKAAEQANNTRLDLPLETYLVNLLDRFTSQPEIFDRIIAIDFMQAGNCAGKERVYYLQEVGDHCLIFSGLFPKLADKRQVKLSYFVDIGRSAYSSVSQDMDDLFTHLSYQFVTLMDVLQSIRPEDNLLPLEAYEQWQELGSKRAKRLLDSYTGIVTS